MELTPRMINWINTFGVHIATANKNGYPTVIVAGSAASEGSTIAIALHPRQAAQIKDNITTNPYVAIAPGQIGAIRAPYQFKGPARISEDKLVVTVQEIYCTKPGAEAGIRLDTLGFEEMKDFDESRWKDISPVM